MVIGIDASRANISHRTGTERYSFQVIDQFKRIAQDHRIVLYSPSPLLSDLSNLPRNFSLRILRNFLGFLWSQARLSLELALHPTDVLYVPAHTIPLILRSPSVVTIHDLGFEHFQELYGSSRLGPPHFYVRAIAETSIRVLSGFRYGATELDYHRWSVRRAAHRSTRIIAVSHFTKKDIIERLKVNPEKIVVIPHGLDHARYHQNIDKHEIMRVQKQYAIHSPYILTIGRIERKKNILRLVHAFAQLKDLYANERLKLVCVGSRGLGADDVEREIEREGLSKHVMLTGWINDDDARYLLAGAHVFAFPSLFEGFGMPILEAMAMGVPVVCSNTTALPEVADDAALLVDPLNTESIASHLRRAATDGVIREQLKKRGLNRAAQFSWEKCARDTLNTLVDAGGRIKNNNTN